jgi:hypothetical protein
VSSFCIVQTARWLTTLHSMLMQAKHIPSACSLHSQELLDAKAARQFHSGSVADIHGRVCPDTPSLVMSCQVMLSRRNHD